MDYNGALQYLNSFINYEKIGYKDQRAFKLNRMRQLADIFKNPQDAFYAIHITGTKGKGSIASFTSNILIKAGLKVGLYTSPHLNSPLERIKLNGETIKEDEFTFYVDEIKRKLARRELPFSPTFFEIYTILAFNYFRAKKIDYGVIEVGLGGRLDATNVVNPGISFISPISYDHTDILGSKLEIIALEKSGIIKKNCVAVSAPQKRSVLKVIEEKCRALGIKLILVGKDLNFKESSHDDKKEIFDIYGKLAQYKGCVIHLLGRHQLLNATSAVAICEVLKENGIRITEKDIKEGLENTKNPARCEIVNRNPYVILDGAQNKASATALKETIERNFNYNNLILVLGISKKKDIKGILQALSPITDIIILTKAKIERAEEPEHIKHFINKKNVILTKTVEEAINKAKAIASKKDLILITGSFFVISEVQTKTKEVIRH